MKIQEAWITDRQNSWNQQSGSFPKNCDTVKVINSDTKWYQHDDEVYATKSALRKALSREYGGAWVEEKEGKKRFFIDDSGWFQTSFKKVSKEEFLQRLDSPSTLQKVLGIGLGILALLPGAVEIKERLPFGASEAGMGLLALQKKSPLLGALGYSFLPSSAEAQAVGTEFQINTYTTLAQQDPELTSLNDGGFVVTWQSIDQDGDSWGVFGQRYDAVAGPVGTEFQINNFTIGNQNNPAISSLDDGRFIVIWQSDGQDGNSFGLFGQIFEANSTKSGLEFQINNFTSSAQNKPSIAPMDDGGFIATWQSENQDGDSWGVFGQRFNASGVRVGTEFQINNFTASGQQDPSISSLDDEGSVVIWRSLDQDGDDFGIFGQQYNLNGTKRGLEFQVNNYTTNAQNDPSVSSLVNRGFVVVWTSLEQDGDNYGIFGQRYDSNGAKNGSDFQINNHTLNSQVGPSVSSLINGGFVITWQSFGQGSSSSWDIFGQRYAESGIKDGSEFQINTYVLGTQDDPSISSLNDGGFVVVWRSFDQDGSGWGVFGQRYDSNGTAIPLSNQSSLSSPSVRSTQLSPTSSSTTENNVLSSSPASSTPSPSISASQTTKLMTTPSNQVGSSASQTTHQPGSPSPSGSQIPLLIEVVYGEVYSFQQNGQTIGTFTISGGSGQYSGGNSNTLTIEIDPDFVLQDGVTITLFSVPDGEEPQWEGVTFLNSDDCFSAEGELVESEENNGLDYQVIFGYQGESCSYNVGVEKIKALSALIGGNLI